MAGHSDSTSVPKDLVCKKFTAGQLIVSALPYAHVVSMQHNGNYCDWCMFPPEEGSKLSKCSSCKYEHYCNKLCQKKAWRYHKFECPLLKKRLPRVPADSVRLLTKLVWNVSQNILRPDDDPAWRLFTDMCDHISRLPQDENRMEEFAKIVITLQNYLGDLYSTLVPNNTELLRIFGRMVFNTFTIVHFLNEEIGAAVYVSPSVFDHSCQPNAVFVSNGHRIFVRAVRDIDTSVEPIYVNYIDPMMPCYSRQSELYKSYFFTCKCVKCMSDSQPGSKFGATVCPKCNGDATKTCDDTYFCQVCNTELDDSLFISSAHKLEKAAMELSEKFKKSDNVDELKSFLKRNKILSTDNVCISILKREIYTYESQFGDMAKAYEIGENLTETYKMHYPEHFPVHGTHQLKQARLAWHLEHHDLALKHYTKAVYHLNITHGSDSFLTKTAKSDMNKCREDQRIYESMKEI